MCASAEGEGGGGERDVEVEEFWMEGVRGETVIGL